VALWQVRVLNGSVTLTYFESILTGKQASKGCGRGPADLLRDVEAFAADQACPWDVVESPQGAFVRQAVAVDYQRGVGDG